MHDALSPVGPSIRLDLGRRVELVSMDPYCEDISVGLYLRESAGESVGTVHSYSGRPGTRERLMAIAETMRLLGGLDADAVEVRFPCHSWHGAAAKRLFLEACKHDPAKALENSALEVPDTRSGQRISVIPRQGGVYDVYAEGFTEAVPSRAPAVARAIAKLAELEVRGGDQTTVVFPCHQPHDDLIALLLSRAQNLRQLLREEELQAGRGVLSAPSAQK